MENKCRQGAVSGFGDPYHPTDDMRSVASGPGPVTPPDLSQRLEAQTGLGYVTPVGPGHVTPTGSSQSRQAPTGSGHVTPIGPGYVTPTGSSQSRQAPTGSGHVTPIGPGYVTPTGSSQSRQAPTGSGHVTPIGPGYVTPTGSSQSRQAPTGSGYVTPIGPGYVTPTGSSQSRQAPTGSRHVTPIGPGYVTPTGSSQRRQAPTGSGHVTPSGTRQNLDASARAEVQVKIIEQPDRRAPKFRYEKEGRFAGSILGASSTQRNKTYPSIEIFNYTGKVKIVVSCVTKNPPHRPHPHKIVGRANHCSYEDGVCIMNLDITPENRVASFTNIGIQCVKRNQVKESLAKRKIQNIDPYKTGFEHSPDKIDLHAVRLCFQVFIPNRVRGEEPVVSNAIYNRSKDPSDLHILETSCTSGSVRGNTRVILLCEKLNPNDINVMLCKDDSDGTAPWVAHAQSIKFHKQVAIVFDTPPYRDENTLDHVTVNIYLQNKSSGERSNRIPFTYIPVHRVNEYLRRKRKKPMDMSLLENIEEISLNWNQEAIKLERADNATPASTWMQVGGSSPNELGFHGNTYQQWDPNTPGTSNMDYHYEKFRCPASYQVPLQYQPNMHLHMQTRSPMHMSNMTVTSTNVHFKSPKAHQMPPHNQVMLPQNLVTSPLVQDTLPPGLLPQGQIRSTSFTSTEDLEGYNITTGPGHIMEYVSQNVAQQSVTKPIEYDDASPMAEYHVEQGGDSIDSGEIKKMIESLGDANQTLDDCISLLSTSDLLNPETS